MVINIIWCVKIYIPKLKTKTYYPDGFNLKGEFEYISHPIEKDVDVGCFNPENWDIMIRTHIRKRSTQ